MSPSTPIIHLVFVVPVLAELSDVSVTEVLIRNQRQRQRDWTDTLQQSFLIMTLKTRGVGGRNRMRRDRQQH